MNICDLQAYMELIVELTPKSVLDVGMIMRRFSMVSRNAANCTIPDSTYLAGLDFRPECAFPIEQKIYDRKFTAEEYLAGSEGFEFAAMLTDDIPAHVDKKSLAHKLASSCRYFLTYYDNHVLLPEEVLRTAQSITIDQSRYLMAKRV